MGERMTATVSLSEVAEPASALSLRDVQHTFAANKVVKGIDLDIAQGEVVCLLGPSGCGKTTLLRIAAGLEVVQEGTVSLEGQAIAAPGKRHVPPEKRNVGLAFQDSALFPHLSVLENVTFGLKHLPSSQRRERALELLTQLGMADYADTYPHMLSGGQQQRVALARALAPTPKLMLLDEPFSSLDARLRDRIRDDTLHVLKKLGSATLLVTHDPEEAMFMADRIALMRDGKIVQQGAPYNVYTRPVDRASVAFFSDANVLRAGVSGALAQTVFGRFLAPGVPDGTQVDIVFRPQHLRIDFDRAGKGPLPTSTDGTAARAVVARARFMGNESLVEFVMDHDGSTLRATVPNVFLPQPGAVMWLTVRRDRCFVFPVMA